MLFRSTTDVDILFVIDNSGSMGSNQSSFKSNFSSFISVFAAAGVDYRIAFITTDSPDFVDGIIVTPSDPDPINTVNGIVDNIGTRGSPTEKGLEQSYNSTSTGPGAPGGSFFREDARLVVIFVSDEPDYSTGGWSSYLSFFDSLNSNRVAQNASIIFCQNVLGGFSRIKRTVCIVIVLPPETTFFCDKFW